MKIRLHFNFFNDLDWINYFQLTIFILTNLSIHFIGTTVCCTDLYLLSPFFLRIASRSSGTTPVLLFVKNSKKWLKIQRRLLNASVVYSLKKMSQNTSNSQRKCSGTSFLTFKCEKTSKNTKKLFFGKILNFSNFCRTFVELFFGQKNQNFFLFRSNIKPFIFIHRHYLFHWALRKSW